MYLKIISDYNENDYINFVLGCEKIFKERTKQIIYGKLYTNSAHPAKPMAINTAVV